MRKGDENLKRRSFLKSTLATGLYTGISPYLKPIHFTTETGQAAATPSCRVLVLIHLDGGNDGINTVIPYTDPLYEQFRPNLKVTNPIPISSSLGFHPSLQPLETFYRQNEMAIIQDVGYLNPDLSHQRAEEILFSASDNTLPSDPKAHLQTGWIGRFLETLYPDYPNVRPDHPPAILFNDFSNMLLEGNRSSIGLTMRDFQAFIDTAWFFDATGVEYLTGNVAYNSESNYVAEIHHEMQKQFFRIRDVYRNTTNKVTHSYSPIGQAAAVIARLIAGGFETPVYALNFSGFDTHFAQVWQHGNQLSILAQDVAKFFEDLHLLGIADKVMVMTTTEFGRHPKENFDIGTEHGTCAPIFLIGPEVNGGLYGSAQNLSDLDENGNLKLQHDFRSVYASVLQNWFGLTPLQSFDILNGDFPVIPISSPCGPVSVEEFPTSGFRLYQNQPNPVRESTTIPFTISGGRASIKLFDMNGKEVATLADSDYGPGTHNVTFNPVHLSSGTYIYRLESRGRVESRTMVVTK